MLASSSKPNDLRQNLRSRSPLFSNSKFVLLTERYEKASSALGAVMGIKKGISKSKDPRSEKAEFDPEGFGK